MGRGQFRCDKDMLLFSKMGLKKVRTPAFSTPKKSEGTRTFVIYLSNNHPEKCRYPHFRHILSPQKYQTPQFLSYFHPKTIQIRCLLVDFHPKKHGKHHFYKTITKKQKIGKIPEFFGGKFPHPFARVRISRRAHLFSVAHTCRAANTHTCVFLPSFCP